MLHSVERAHTYAHSFPGYKIIADSLWEHAANAFPQYAKSKIDSLFRQISVVLIFHPVLFSGA